jgi:hypothetical protein
MTEAEQIWQWVWLGFYTSEEIMEMMMEETWQTYFDYKTNADTLQNKTTDYQSLIEKYFNEKNKTSANWEIETDVDKLEAIFETLRTEGDAASIHLAGSDYEEAIENINDVFEEMEEEAEENISNKFCFYLESDAINLLPDFENPTTKKGNLSIYFGKKEGSDIENLALGQLIFQHLKNNSFKCIWSQDGTQPILIQDFEWQNRNERWKE